MKTTLDLPDDLVREVKVKAAQEGRKLKDLVPDLIRRGLQSEATTGSRVNLPLVECPTAGDSMTPEQVAAILAADEADSAEAK